MTDALSLHEWLRERLANCLRLARQTSGSEQSGWLEDAEYLRQTLILLDQFETVDCEVTSRAVDLDPPVLES